MARGGVIIPLLTEFKPEGIDKAIREFKKLETTTQKIGFGLEKAFVPALGVLAGFGAAAVPAIKAAADMGETISKAGVLFGGATDTVVKFAEGAASALGQSQQQALDAAATFATFGKSAGLAGADLATFSTDFVTLASDLASFNNTTPEQAIEAIGAALRGEAEPMRQFGVLLDDATLRQRALEMGIIDTVKNALTPQQKVLAAQAEIFAQTSDAQGDFERTSGSLANQQKILTAEFANLQVEIGQVLLPIAGKFVDVLRTMIGLVDDNQTTFMVLAGGIAAVSGAIVIANVAMKTYAGLQTIVKVANTVLGTSFKLTTTNLMKATGAMGAVGAALALGTIAYQVYTDRKKEAEQTTKDLAAALFLEGEAQQQALSDLAANNDAVRRFLAAVESLGVGMGDVTQFVADGTGALSDLVPAIEGVVTQVKGTNPELAALAKQFLGVTTQSDDLNQAYGELTREQVLAAVAIRDFVPEIRRLQGEEENRASATSLVANVTRDMTEAQKEAEEAAKDMSTAAQDVSKRLETYRERLTNSLETTQAWRDRLREATQSGAESFNDFTVDAGTSIEKFRQDLLQSAQNAFDWQNNLLRIAQLTSPEFASYLADMGLAGADLVADLANSGDDIQAVFDAFVINQQVMSRDFLRGFDSTAEGVRRRMADIKTAVENSLPPGATMYQKAMAIGDAIYGGIVDALEAGEKNVAWAAAALADTAIIAGKNAIDARSPSKVAEWEIGRPIADGVAVGITNAAPAASKSMNDMMSQVTEEGIKAAEDLVRSIEDQIDGIFSAIGARRSEERLIKRVDDAQRDLTEAQENFTKVTKGAGAESQEYKDALREVQDAEWRLADVKDRQIDVTQRVMKAQLEVNEALQQYGLGSPQWQEATRQLESESRAYEKAQRDVSDAEAELADRRETAKGILSGYAEGTKEYTDAANELKAAQDGVRDANLELLESQQDLIGKGPEAEKTFRDIAAAAGLERDEIDKLVTSLNNLSVARSQEAQARAIAAQAPPTPAPVKASPAPKPTPAPVKPVPAPRPTPAPVRPGMPGIPGRSAAGGSRMQVRNIGGPVFGIEGRSVPITAHGGEYVLSADVVDAIKRGAPSRGLGRGGAVGGTGNIINITVTSADPQAVVDAIRKYNKTNGPAPIRIAS